MNFLLREVNGKVRDKKPFFYYLKSLKNQIKFFLCKFPIILYYPFDLSQKVKLIIIRKVFQDYCYGYGFVFSIFYIFEGSSSLWLEKGTFVQNVVDIT